MSTPIRKYRDTFMEALENAFGGDLTSSNSAAVMLIFKDLFSEVSSQETVLTEEKNYAIHMHEVAVAERNSLADERDAAIKECDEAINDCTKVIKERDAAIKERNVVIKERDIAIAEKNDAIKERDAAIKDRDYLTRVRDEAVDKHSSIIVDYERAMADNYQLGVKLDNLNFRLTDLDAKNKRLIEEQNALIKERDDAVKSRDAALNLRDDVVAKRDEYNQLVDILTEQTKTTHQYELDKLKKQSDDEIAKLAAELKKVREQGKWLASECNRLIELLKPQKIETTQTTKPTYEQLLTEKRMLVSERDALIKTQSTLKVDIDVIVDECNTLREKISELEAENTDMQETLDQTGDIISTARNLVGEFTSDIASLLDDHTVLKITNGELLREKIRHIDETLGVNDYEQTVM